MARVNRGARGVKHVREKVLAAEAPDAEDSPTPQNVDREPPHVWSRTGQQTYSYGSAKTNLAYQLFADALRQAMVNNKLSASEVARRVWGTTKDRRGYEVARNRDRIGHYLAGTSYPEPDNLQKLADAVGVPVDDLKVERPGGPTFRPRVHGAIISGTLVQTAISDQPEKMRLQVDRIVGWELAAKIFELLKKAELSEVEAQANMAHELNDFAKRGKSIGSAVETVETPPRVA